MSDQVEFSFVTRNSQAIREIDRLRDKLDELEKRILRTTQTTRSSSGAYTAYGAAAASGTGRVRGLGDAATRAASQIKITGSNAASATSLLNRLGIAATNAGKQMATAQQQARGLSGGVNLLNASIAGIGIGAVAGSVIETTAAFKGYDQALKIVLGSQSAARAEMDYVKSTANEYGFRVRDLTSEYVKLTAASKGTVLEGRNTRAIFDALTRAGAAYSLTSETMGGALTAVQQMMSKGKVSAEELRGQLGERLPGAFQIAARAMGVTTQQLDKMLQSGELLASDFLPKFAAQLRKEIPEGAESATAGFNRFLSQMDEAKVILGTSGFFDALSDSAGELTQQLKGLAEDGSLKRFGSFLGDIVRLIVALLPYTKSLVAGFVAYKIAAIAATIATNGLTRAMLLNPALAIAVGVAALVLAIDDLSAASNQAATANGEYKKSADALAKSQEDHAKVLRDLSSATDAERAASLRAAEAARTKAIADVNAAKAALARAAAERELAASMAAKAHQQVLTESRSLRGAAAGYDPGIVAVGRAQDADGKLAQAAANERQAQANLREAGERVQSLEAAIAALKTTGSGAGSAGSTGTNRSSRSTTPKVDEYKKTIGDLREELANLTLTEEERKLADALESAGLERNIKLTGEKADAIRDLVRQIKAAEDAKQVQDTIKELEESYNALALSETQLAQVEARRRAGLPVDLTIQNELTRQVDEYAASILRATKAKQAAEAARGLGTDVDRARRDTQLDMDLATGVKTADEVEHERAINAILDERAGQLAQIRDMEVITLAERAAGMAGITAEEKLALEAAVERLAVERKATVGAQEQQAELKRQIELSEQLSDFLVDLWENPKEAMKKFFRDLMRKLLEAILQAVILKNTLSSASAGGGGGGIGGIIGNALMSAIGGGRATGGSVRAGEIRPVGEHGPELVRFGAAGQVFSNKKVFGNMGGGNFTFAPSYVLQASGNRQQDDLTLAMLKAQTADQNRQIRSQQNVRPWNG